ncbi:hypothetical protein BVJ53_13465 [Lacticaseibacillus chiayiensis]|uniref:Uncharacterized protein n=1 Tax=Lacticaseibacillus chiayiensis TaxID=2100821 RepID=A0A4V1NZX1_9LACO|nr:hypothetical protein [Lacticaseibacillus chiayiensis]QVI36088.1 hypothetical protein KG086_08390 [Lacticaseibacillus chiayiensis]RXT18500.1 hypothetical protein BVJ53_13465 [Lacticaseibacillus chiayiensis]UYN57890.1 hypothetical protein OFW50_08730 [Lacticaseibacillus chiayiensis]
MRTNWRLFHKADAEAKYKRFLFGLNEYITEQGAIDIALDTVPKLKQSYETYLNLHEVLVKDKDPRYWQGY